jgi:signal transduction histidine kinase
MLGFLRREGEADDLAPQPGLGELDGLVDQVRQANLEVAVSVEGQPQPLSRSLEVCAYRIIQEALTNTIKHAGAGTATVCLRYEPSVFQVEVLDDGKGTSTATDQHRRGGGHGLIGMRERVSLHGGQLRTGPRPNGGFGVDAVFPLDAGSG